MGLCGVEQVLDRWVVWIAAEDLFGFFLSSGNFLADLFQGRSYGHRLVWLVDILDRNNG